MKNKVLVVVILLVVSVFISIGFAAFSKDLKIEEFSAEVNPDNNFTTNVKFKEDTLQCTPESLVSSVGDLSNDGVSWSGLSVLLKNPGDSVSCSVRIANNSSYVAYLKSISFSDKLTCAPKIGTDTTQAAMLCGEDGVYARVTIGDDSATVKGSSVTNSTNINNNTININGDVLVNFDIVYSSTAKNIDDDVIVTIPEVNFNYQSSN